MDRVTRFNVIALSGKAVESCGDVDTIVSNYNTSDTNESSISSGGFNYAMSNPALKGRVQKDLQKFLDENSQITKEQIPLRENLLWF